MPNRSLVLALAVGLPGWAFVAYGAVRLWRWGHDTESLIRA